MTRALAFFFVSAALPASAGGYQVSEQDAAATGRGGTGVGALEGAASVHYNPANLSRVFSLTGAVGGTAIAPMVSAVDPSTNISESAEFGVKTPPHAYAAYGNGKYGVGLGFNTPFGGGLRWADDFRGRFEIIEQNLQVFAGHVGFAYQLHKQFSAGLTGTIYRGTVRVEKRVDFVDHEGTAVLGGAGTAFGLQAGVSYAPTDFVRLGLTARLPSNIPLNGRAHFSEVPDSFDPLLQDQEINAAIPIPARVAFGSAFYLDSVRLFADFDYTMWSAFERFSVQFTQSESLNVDAARNWENAFGIRMGAEKDLTDVMTVRGGVFFDQKTSPADTLSPSSPDSDRIGLSLGGGRDFGMVRADAAYMFVLFVPRKAEGLEAFPATYNATAHMLAVTFRFNTPPGVAARSADRSDNSELIEPLVKDPAPRE